MFPIRRAPMGGMTKCCKTHIVFVAAGDQKDSHYKKNVNKRKKNREGWGKKKQKKESKLKL